MSRRIREPIGTATRVVGLAVGVWLALSHAHASPPEADAWLLLGVGRDTNPTRHMGDGPDGSFAEARYDAELDQVFTPRWKWFFDADGFVRQNESAVSHGDRQAHFTRLGLGLAPVSLRKERVLFQVGATYRIDRSTFLDRTTGDPFTVSVPEPGAAAPQQFAIPDRYDADTIGVFFDGYWQPAKRVRLSLETGIDHTDYRQDYPAGSTLRPLDNRSIHVEPGIQYRVTRELMLGLSLQVADIEYDEELGRDASGTIVPGSRREFRYTDARLTANWSPLSRVKLSGSFLGGTREDALDGYYDYDTRASSLQVEIIARRDLQFRLSGYRRDRKDADLRVTALPFDERDSERERVRATMYWTFHQYLGLFAEVARQSDVSWQPEYTYDEDWALAGIAFNLQ